MLPSEIREHQPGRQDDHKADDADRQINVILAGAAEHFQAGAAVTAAVAAALHGHRQLVRPAERRDEQRDEDGHQPADLYHQPHRADGCH